MSGIVRKIRALLLKAEGTIGPESDAFMSKVRELMAAHQIEMHTLRQEPDPLGQHKQGLMLNRSWQLGVCNIGAEYLGCAAIFHRFEDSSLFGCALYGRQSACATATELLRYWIREVERLAQHYDVNEEKLGNALTLRFTRLLAQDGPAPSNGTDLVPIDEAKAAAMNAETIEMQDVVVQTSINELIVAENISLNLQAAGPQRHKEIR